MRKVGVVVLFSLMIYCLLVAVEAISAHFTKLDQSSFEETPNWDLGRPASGDPQSTVFYDEAVCKGQIGKPCGGPGQSCQMVEVTYLASPGRLVNGCYCADMTRGPVKDGKNTLPHPACSYGTH